ncbi:bulb-type lectin domain-containing protein [Pyrenochaeta sp. MPI-SDFR-AT-0127]|nr:bulb-type lectin domain-containing protein [Pyrenochaeta sp. MPI-SDFR-AT-0127]
MSAELGHLILVPAEFLGGSSTSQCTVRWAQMLKQQEETYIVCPFHNLSKRGPQGLLFVQASKVDELKGKKITGRPDVSLRVTKDFLYGGPKDQSRRFLIYHDKAKKMFQHRFLMSITDSDMLNRANSLGFSADKCPQDYASEFKGKEQGTDQDTPPLNRLKTGEKLAKQESLYSPDWRYRVTLQSDGNFVLYDSNGAIWHSNTYYAKDATHVIIQPDGNLVLYRASGDDQTPWSSGTSGNHVAPEVTLENDGRLRILAGGKEIWSVGKQ